MKKATTKRERKYGKKESKELEELTDKKVTKKLAKKDIVMYKILIDRANFSKPMTYEKCVEFINNENERSRKVFQAPPHMSLVKI